MTARLAAAVLVLEAFVVFFGTLVAARTTDLPAVAVWCGGLALALLCVLSAGMVRRPRGLAVGTVVQVVLLLTGLAVPAMWLVGALFLAVWLWMVRLGRRIDTDRATWAATGDGSGPDYRVAGAGSGGPG